jgi:hypothetical protein
LNIFERYLQRFLLQDNPSWAELRREFHCGAGMLGFIVGVGFI